jgi:hypothetical protein
MDISVPLGVHEGEPESGKACRRTGYRKKILSNAGSYDGLQYESRLVSCSPL